MKEISRLLYTCTIITHIHVPVHLKLYLGKRNTCYFILRILPSVLAFLKDTITPITGSTHPASLICLFFRVIMRHDWQVFSNRLRLPVFSGFPQNPARTSICWWDRFVGSAISFVMREITMSSRSASEFYYNWLSIKVFSKMKEFIPQSMLYYTFIRLCKKSMCALHSLA